MKGAGEQGRPVAERMNGCLVCMLKVKRIQGPEFRGENENGSFSFLLYWEFSFLVRCL